MDGRQTEETEAFIKKRALYMVNDPLEDLDRTAVLTCRVVEKAHWKTGDDAQRKIRELSSDCQGALAGLGSRFGIANHSEMLGEVRGDPAEPPLVVNPRRQAFRLLEIFEDFAEIAEWLQRIADIETDVDCVFKRFAILR